MTFCKEYHGKKGLRVVDEGYRWVVYPGYIGKHKYLRWDNIPSQWVPFWQKVTLSLFLKRGGMTGRSVYLAATKLHRWLEDRCISSFDELTALDFSLWVQWLLNQPRQIRGGSLRGTLCLGTAECMATSLRCGFAEAIAMERPELSEATLIAVRDGTRHHFRHTREKASKLRSERVLSHEEADRVFEAVLNEYNKAKTMMLSPQRPSHPGIEMVPVMMKATRWGPGCISSRQKRTVDLVAATALLLGLGHGVRAEELPQLRLSDFQEDTSDQGNHLLLCAAPNKPPSPVTLGKLAGKFIKTLIEWTDDARRESNTDFLFVDWVKAYNKPPHPLTAEDIRKRLREFAKRYCLVKSGVATHDAAGNLLPLQPTDYITATMKNLRSTFGDLLASHTTNRSIIQDALRHEWYHTSEVHYHTKNQVEHAKVVARALSTEATKQAILYGYPVIDLRTERPDVAKMLADNPDRDLGAGICSTKQDCLRATHCFFCDLLIVECSRRLVYVRELSRLRVESAATKDPRVRQRKETLAERAEILIRLIDRRLAEAEAEASEDQPKEPIRPRKRTNRPVDF